MNKTKIKQRGYVEDKNKTNIKRWRREVEEALEVALEFCVATSRPPRACAGFLRRDVSRSYSPWIHELWWGGCAKPIVTMRFSFLISFSKNKIAVDNIFWSRISFYFYYFFLFHNDEPLKDEEEREWLAFDDHFCSFVIVRIIEKINRSPHFISMNRHFVFCLFFLIFSKAKKTASGNFMRCWTRLNR